MAKHPTSARVPKKDAGPDDAFVSAVKRTYAWGRQNSRVLTIVLAVVLVVGSGTIWYLSQQSSLERQAAARFAQVQQSVAAGNAELAIRDLQDYLNRFGGTEAADQARLLLASILLEEDRADEALQALTSVATDLDAPFGLPAARLRAAVLEEQGRFDDAVNTFLRVADGARFDYQRREALADAARVRFQHGDPQQAAELYQRVLETLEDDDPQHSYYEMWLAEARAAADRGVAVPVNSDTAAQPTDEAQD